MKIVILLFLVFAWLGMVFSRPALKTIVIDGHEWQVPDEEGWEEVIQNVQAVQKKLLTCATKEECQRIVQEIRDIFNRYPVSKDYFDTINDDAYDMFSTIFKWG